MKKILSALLLVSLTLSAQKKPAAPERPKLVIGIVVDQMRADYVYRFADKFGKGGFRRFLSNGFDCRNTYYNYVPTYTGPGHAAVYTGSVPAYNGIISNDWYDRKTKKSVYVAGDDSVNSVGTESSAGKMSPSRLLSTTVTDELRLSNNRQSKVIGVCLKDRGSIMPAGHIPSAAYWFDNKTGNWITSTYYTDALPQWVVDFNARKLCDTYLSKPWETLLPLDQYTVGLENGSGFRVAYRGEKDNRFPHDLPALKGQSGYELMRSTPFGDSYTVDFALEVLEKEKMGKGRFTDFLAVSFSCTDYVGHQFGINAIETQDTYARLDRDLERLFDYVEKNIGMENVLIFLTADHGAAQTPDYLTSLHIPAGFLPTDTMVADLNRAIAAKYGEGDWIEYYGNQQVYLNYATLESKKAERSQIVGVVVDYLRKQPGVQEVFDIGNPSALQDGNPQHARIANGLSPLRSGDVALLLQPSWFDGEHAAHGGTTHGSGWTYDTHVPLLWMGWKIKSGSSAEPVSISDIAVTVADLLRISWPNAAVGRPISDRISQP
ncbi:alkaline phosphatase PafA [Flavobacterium sp. HJ-32-4]|uniref:alkaline phosphatase PafA n=1 Tax=Flavobacterium sp. HJ-32-4 TaxID=1160795 RepID=UPI001F143464|nr:alkaline phosphatase PafA [Flavobacterium sp. HJ-32-4]UMY64961.1 alkaline phosphatase family protein [Flavobacterium sp. HJ-32-4]